MTAPYTVKASPWLAALLAAAPIIEPILQGIIEDAVDRFEEDPENKRSLLNSRLPGAQAAKLIEVSISGHLSLLLYFEWLDSQEWLIWAELPGEHAFYEMCIPTEKLN